MGSRTISRRDTLIEVLAARGRWIARRREVAAARRDLEEALGDAAAARGEAERAQTMSVEMGYHWGQVVAAEILALLPK